MLLYLSLIKYLLGPGKDGSISYKFFLFAVPILYFGYFVFNSNDFIELADKLNPLTHDDPHEPWHRKYGNVDLEAQAVYYVSEMIIEKFKNPDEDDEVIRKKYTDKLYEIINKKKEELENERTSSDNTDA